MMRIDGQWRSAHTHGHTRNQTPHTPTVRTVKCTRKHKGVSLLPVAGVGREGMPPSLPSLIHPYTQCVQSSHLCPPASPRSVFPLNSVTYTLMPFLFFSLFPPTIPFRIHLLFLSQPQVFASCSTVCPLSHLPSSPSYSLCLPSPSLFAASSFSSPSSSPRILSPSSWPSSLRHRAPLRELQG